MAIGHLHRLRAGRMPNRAAKASTLIEGHFRLLVIS
jgi:hypothetical protein